MSCKALSHIKARYTQGTKCPNKNSPGFVPREIPVGLNFIGRGYLLSLTKRSWGKYRVMGHHAATKDILLSVEHGLQLFLYDYDFKPPNDLHDVERPQRNRVTWRSWRILASEHLNNLTAIPAIQAHIDKPDTMINIKCP
ncbi:hypothetical protein V6N13_098896 [Hibiscus sabdariffa]|uniref:Uncharacterized protein n=1 Tax=Hibiscus sabdariffa TaxID=183260 RepID=A0ABR2EFP1_9ROSI